MSEVEWLAEPSGDRPIVVIALRGLFDAAGAATNALAHMRRQRDGGPIASIDPEVFFNFTEERPIVSIDDEGLRQLTWPSNEAIELPGRDGQRDLLLISGVEPHLRWRTFSDAVASIATRCDADLVVTMGAMVGMAPHTRPLGVVGSATNPQLAKRLGLGRPSYEGPTGLIGALHVALDDAGLAVISLRVSIPHYVPSPPNPEATRSLLARFELATGVTTGHADLDIAAEDWRRRVDKAVGDDEEMAGYVRQLERQVDAAADELLPSGDDLAAELQAFLRDRRDP